jgi:hypothetical protein
VSRLFCEISNERYAAGSTLNFVNYDFVQVVKTMWRIHKFTRWAKKIQDPLLKMCVNRLDLRKIQSPYQQNGIKSKQTGTNLTELQSTPVTTTTHKHKQMSFKPSSTAIRFPYWDTSVAEQLRTITCDGVTPYSSCDYNWNLQYPNYTGVLEFKDV